MKEIIIEPNIGIDQLKLGMTSDEIEAAFLRMRNDWQKLEILLFKWNALWKPMTQI